MKPASKNNKGIFLCGIAVIGASMQDSKWIYVVCAKFGPFFDVLLNRSITGTRIHLWFTVNWQYNLKPKHIFPSQSKEERNLFFFWPMQ